MARDPSQSPTPPKRGVDRSRSRSRSPPRKSSYQSRSKSPPSRSRSRSRTPDRKKRDRSLSPATPALAKRARSRSIVSGTPARETAQPSGPTKLVVNGLSRNVTKAHVEEIFGEYGSMDRCDVPSNHMGMCQGNAYLYYTSPSFAQTAEKYMNGAIIDGQTVRCHLTFASGRDLAAGRRGGGPPLRDRARQERERGWRF
ncbi:hypothetical protein DFS34DRAFT_639829 [Phlyctochytrium arcticum]|nr:hypothetical protein DFS34DRAFT_639829 [Phlyctochytrium arcticum]